MRWQMLVSERYFFTTVKDHVIFVLKNALDLNIIRTAFFAPSFINYQRNDETIALLILIALFIMPRF